jgi:hypothetical protein
LFGVKVTGLPAEISASIPTAGTAFTLADLGQVQNTKGSALQTASDAAAVTQFLRLKMVPGIQKILLTFTL